MCRPTRSFLYVGLRGVGKTVLLNQVREIAEKQDAISDFMEVGTSGPLAHTIIATLRAALMKLDRVGVSGPVRRGLRVLKSFAGTARIRKGELEVVLPDLDPEPGIADSGMFAHDLAELFVVVGEAARARDTSIVIMIDEIQNLAGDEFGALIMAIHHANQRQLPILVVGAGLPSLVKLSAEVKSYAERLFEYPEVGALDDEGCRQALVEPAVREGVAIDDAVIAAVADITGGYPYFLQEWGYQLWTVSERTPITLADLEVAQGFVVERLDRNFFRSRLDRLTEPERRYLQAMAGLGPGPSHRSGDVAAAMCKRATQLGPTREALIAKGMVYSPGYGHVAFTAPLFDDFMRRTQLR